MSEPCVCPRHAVSVLVVDDDPGIRESLAEMLRDEGYSVRTAANGAEALAAVDKEPPCLMLLDLMMPVMSGWEVASRLVDDDIDVPYCVVSATVSAAPPGATCVLQKPINVDALLRIVAKHCGLPEP